MAKSLEWKIEREDGMHTVRLTYSYFTGKAIVTIDGSRFDISVGMGKLRGTQQAFRLGEEMAVLDFPKKGEPDVGLDGVGLHTGRQI